MVFANTMLNSGGTAFPICLHKLLKLENSGLNESGKDCILIASLGVINLCCE
jgi:hypothetical protein